MSSYVQPVLKRTLFDSTTERNEAFGYTYLQHQPAMQTHLDNYFNPQIPVGDIRTAPKDYYHNMVPEHSTVIGPLGARPNIYNDNLAPGTALPGKTWQTLRHPPAAVQGGRRVTFTPHAPCELSGNSDSRLWVADLNSQLYERNMVSAAKEQPYANWNKRQAMLNMLAMNWQPSGDPYAVIVKNPKDVFCKQLQAHGNIPPAVTHI